jgi:hypothetical protein
MAAPQSLLVVADTWSLSRESKRWLTWAPVDVRICWLPMELSSVESVGRYTVSYTAGRRLLDAIAGGRQLGLFPAEAQPRDRRRPEIGFQLRDGRWIPFEP